MSEMAPRHIEAIIEALHRFDGGAKLAAAFQASAELIGGSSHALDVDRRRNEEWASALRDLLASVQHDHRCHPADCAYHVDQYPHECTCGLMAAATMIAQPPTKEPTP